MIRHENFPSNHVPPRHVDVWLPPGYDAGNERYPVLYIHDGQNCFDAADCGFGVAWDVQHALTRLLAAGEARPAIIVGAWCLPTSEQRVREYCPAKPFQGVSAAEPNPAAALFAGPPQSDAYLTFLVSELKPFIDATYRTLPGHADTFVMGSSMGGLVSLYAICEYPDVFGGAGCVSTHWPAVEGVILPYLRDNLPDPATHRLYFDYGTAGLDAAYPPLQAQVDPLLAAAGYARGENWQTMAFPGADHNEIAWQARVHIPLQFLLRL
jgi:predicted alpha/beta superfamily hydrolase